MALSKVWMRLLLALAVVLSAPAAMAEEVAAAEEATPVEEAVLTLSADNFDDAIAKHPFILVEFYAPWCGHCQSLAPKYEKAAQLLSKHDPPIVLAKVDANDEKNKPLASKYEVQGFPSLKIFRDQGKIIEEYKGPRETEGIVHFLKKQVGPASKEIKAPEDAANIEDGKIHIVGVFAEFSGMAFTNFMEVADNLRSESNYEFGHTLHANHLPRGDAAVEGPLVRLFKPFDELVVDSKDFDVSALESFIEASSIPKVTTMDKNPYNRPYLLKFFDGKADKVMLFVNFSAGPFESFKSAHYGAAEEFKDKEVKFLIGDIEASRGAFEYFGLKKDQAPLIIILDSDSKKFLKEHIVADQIVSWLKEYFDGKLSPFRKSEPIPETNNEPVKVVVADNVNDVVFKSGKNVLVEFYAPWCGHCQQLAPILDEAAATLQSEEDVIIAKLDGTLNDVPTEFVIEGYPTLYFVTPSGKMVQYDGGRTVDEIVDYIRNNKESAGQAAAAVTEDAAATEPLKDEL